MVLLLVGSPVLTGVGITQENTTATTNETATPPAHANPDDVGSSRELSTLDARFQSILAGRLITSTTAVNQSEYERAQELIGEEYEFNLSDYRTIATELDASERAELFERVKTDQQEFIDDVQQIRSLRQEYEAARQAGDEARARSVARELSQKTANFSANATTLSAEYESLSNETNMSFEPAVKNIDTTRIEIENTTTNITNTEFRSTNLTAQINRSNISFADPGRITGRISLSNGTGFSGRVVTVAVGSQSYEVRTSPNGRFQIPYRPVAVQTGSVNVSVQYVPDDGSVYQRASDTIAVNINSVNASVEAFDAPTSVAFRDSVGFEGRIVHDGRTVEALPLNIQANAVPLTTTETGSGGEFRATAQFPSNVNDGEQAFNLTTASDQAVQIDSAQPVTVEVTQTQLRGRVEDRSISSLTISGKLSTRAGQAVANETIRLSAGTQEVTAQTAADGTFSAQLSLISGSLATGDDTVVVAFDGGPDTNLGPASGSLTIQSSSIESLFEQVSPTEQGIPWRGLGIVGAVIATSGGALAVGSRRGWFELRLPDLTDDETVADGGMMETTEPASAETPDVETPVELTRIQTRLNRGELETAVLDSYGRVWEALQAEIPSNPQSHWRLYQASVEHDAGIDTELRTLTATYEQTAYGPGSPNFQSAQSALANAEALLEMIYESDFDA
jgi:hypothetical protein